MTILKNKSLLIIFILLLTTAIIVSSLSLRFPTITIIRTVPNNQDTNLTLVAPIQITFSKPLPKNEEINIISIPQFLGTVNYNSDRTQAIFTPNNLYQPNTTYEVVIKSRSIKDYRFQFSTLKPKTFSDLINSNTTNASTTPTNSENLDLVSGLSRLISSTPHSESSFTLKYIVATDRFIIYPKANITDEEAEKDALDYIKSFGFTDPYKQLNLSLYPSFNPFGNPEPNNNENN